MYLLFYIGYNVPYNILVTMYLIFCISYNVPYNILVTMYLINVNLCTYTKGYPGKGVCKRIVLVRKVHNVLDSGSSCFYKPGSISCTAKCFRPYRG